MMKITKQSFPAQIVVRHTTDKYLFIHEQGAEPTFEGARRLLDSGDFTLEYIGAWSATNAMPTIIITEKEAK